MELLDQLALLTCCDYLSDLRYVDPAHIQDLLLDFSVDNYPFDQWLDAEEYLCRPATRRFHFACKARGERTVKLTSEDVRQRMMGELEKIGRVKAR